MNNIQTFITERFVKPCPHLPEKVYKEILGIPKKTFGKYLRNEEQPTLDEVVKIASWLGVDPKELINF